MYDINNRKSVARTQRAQHEEFRVALFVFGADRTVANVFT